MSSYNTVEDILHEIEGEKKFRGLKYPQLLSLAAIQYFVFKDKDTDRLKKDFLTDGKNDGGFDAIVPLFDIYGKAGEGLVIIQSKYTDNITAGEIEAEWRKIMGTIEKIKGKNTKDIKDAVSSAIWDALKANEKIDVIFMVSAQGANKPNIHEKIEELLDETGDDKIQATIYFGDDLLEQRELVSDTNICVERDSLELWKGSNGEPSILEYEFGNLKGKIVNVSAQSLKHIAEKHITKGLLEGNLRFHTPEKKVDAGIDDTIVKEPDIFWFRNNGITIFSDSVEIEGDQLNIENFSIVNGGQTTARLKRTLHQDTDFPIICKVITYEGDDEDRKNEMRADIAIASNTQKIIKHQDKHSNDGEQRALQSWLEDLDPPIYYEIKRGDLSKKRTQGKKLKKWQKIDFKKMAQIICAMKLARPDEAFGRPMNIFSGANDFYERIFDPYARDIPFIVDAIRLCSYYDDWSKKWLAEHKSQSDKVLEKEEDIKKEAIKNARFEAIKNARFHVLAVISLAIKEMRGDLDMRKSWESQIAEKVVMGSFMKHKDEDVKGDVEKNYHVLFHRISKEVALNLRFEIAKKLKNKDEWEALGASCLEDARVLPEWKQPIQDLFITKKR